MNKQNGVETRERMSGGSNRRMGSAATIACKSWNEERAEQKELGQIGMTQRTCRSGASIAGTSSKRIRGLVEIIM